MFLAIISASSYSWKSEVSAIFVFTTKTTPPRPKVLSVISALACIIINSKYFPDSD